MFPQPKQFRHVHGNIKIYDIRVLAGTVSLLKTCQNRCLHVQHAQLLAVLQVIFLKDDESFLRFFSPKWGWVKTY